MIVNVLGLVLQFQAMFLLLPCMVSGIYREHEGFAFLCMAVVCAVAGTLCRRIKTENKQIYAREGLVIVAFAWIVMSLTGAIPFVLAKEIPSFTDAFFETASGFTTTGASILTDVDAMSKCCLFWRSFTHWIGGMGVIVFIVAILPMTGGQNMHLIRAESPGPSVGKLVPKAKESARILYIIYLALTVAQIMILAVIGMPLFDAITIAFGSAGTGGFAVHSSGVAGYTPLMQTVIAIFVIMFGINFNFYFYLRGKHKKEAFQISEVRWYLGIVLASVIIITANIRGLYEHIGEALHHALFQVACIMTTTGFASADFDVWPILSKSLLVLLMFIGACAGSTGGGLKVSRVIILFKSIRKEIAHIVHPRSVTAVMMDGRSVPAEMSDGVKTYLATYTVIFATSCVLVAAFDATSFETVFTSVAATINNIGPGLGGVGPMANYAWLSTPSKWVLIFDMLAGRLELYPMLILLTPGLWRQK